MSFHFRCSKTNPAKTLSPISECLVFQTHQILHAGLETDVVNDKLTNNTIAGCKMDSQLLFRQDRRLYIVVHATLMHNAFETVSTDKENFFSVSNYKHA